MTLNPYASFLGDQDARAVLAATPGLLHQAVSSMTAEQMEAPRAPGKWCPREIVAHMADCEIAFSYRLRQMLAEPGILLQPFDQTLWSEPYARYGMAEGLSLFRQLREWNLKLIGGLKAADFEKTGQHPERGTMTFMNKLELMAGHDVNHLRQMQEIAART
jgi:hypothetical protein